MQRFLVVLSVAAPLLGGVLPAQEGPKPLPVGSAWGVTVDRFDISSEYRITSLTLHISSLEPNKFKTEFGLVLFPETFGEGAFIANMDLGGAVNLVLPNAVLLVRGGASGILAVGSGGGGALPGLHYGASLLIKIAEGAALRFDVLRRVYRVPFTITEGLPTLSIGVGISSLPRRR